MAAIEGDNVPLEEDVEEQHNEALALRADGENPYPGSTYVDGAIAALGWVLGEADEPPFEIGGD